MIGNHHLTNAPRAGILTSQPQKTAVGFGSLNVYGAWIAAPSLEIAAKLCPSAAGHLRVRRLGKRRRHRSSNPLSLGHPFGSGPELNSVYGGRS